MNEYARALEFREAFDRFLEPVLERLYVMNRHAIDHFDPLRFVCRKALDELQQGTFGFARKTRHFGEARMRERDEPMDFDGHAVAHECGFGKPVAQGFGLGGVATVERRERGEGKKS